VIGGGYVVAAAGLSLLALAGSAESLALLVAGYMVMALGLAPVFTLATDLIIGTVSPERAGTAAGMAETSSEFGGALGIAILGSIVTAIYGGVMTTTMPEGIPAEVAETARDTVGGAVAEAGMLGGAVGEGLLTAAREAYAQSFQVAVVICAVVALAAGLMAMALLRNVRPADHDMPLAEEPVQS
jgi:DHA2 family multidrug resistance protein-like MFS transporter